MDGEAVAVIRALGDTTSGQTSQSGLRHRLVGAQTGPVVQRAVPLWLAGSGAAVAALAGRVADGWMTDLDEVGVDGLAALTTVLDRVAVEAGRDVREVRRSVTLTSLDASDVDALVALVVDHGVSSFLLRVEGSAGSASRVRAFVDDVAPAVRDRADRALPPGALSSRPVRRADVLARRRPGIAYDEIPESLAEAAVEPGDTAFAKVRSTYLRGGRPGLVLRPRDAQEVVDAVGFAADIHTCLSGSAVAGTASAGARPMTAAWSSTSAGSTTSPSWTRPTAWSASVPVPGGVTSPPRCNRTVGR